MKLQPNIYHRFFFFFFSAIKKGGNFEHPHTAFVHHSPLYVRDITSEPLKDDQVASRVLLKAFTVAAAKAQSLYGVNCHFFHNHHRKMFTILFYFFLFLLPFRLMYEIYPNQ